MSGESVCEYECECVRACVRVRVCMYVHMSTCCTCSHAQMGCTSLISTCLFSNKAILFFSFFGITDSCKLHWRPFCCFFAGSRESGRSLALSLWDFFRSLLLRPWTVTGSLKNLPSPRSHYAVKGFKSKLRVCQCCCQILKCFWPGSLVPSTMFVRRNLLIGHVASSTGLALCVQTHSHKTPLKAISVTLADET